ncbi:hypothetical protein BSKO_06355 [Bryopsis sp. KO-2023]|nr:hypothetical protein BSKO_06355 [Bryopsis sp. KO-2023]
MESKPGYERNVDQDTAIGVPAEVPTDSTKCQKKCWGYEWKTQTTIFGWPLLHFAVGRDETGCMRVAKGVIAVGQFAIGLGVLSQFGIGVFGISQFLIALFGIGQFILCLMGLGQFIAGILVFGQMAAGVSEG